MGYYTKEKLTTIMNNPKPLEGVLSKAIINEVDEARRENLNTGPIFEIIGDIAMRLINRLNPDACITEAQLLEIKKDIVRLALQLYPGKQSLRDKLILLLQNNEDYTDLDRFKDRPINELDIAANLNATRLECANCLNDACSFRDPEAKRPKLELPISV